MRKPRQGARMAKVGLHRYSASVVGWGGCQDAAVHDMEMGEMGNRVWIERTLARTAFAATSAAPPVAVPVPA
jgi:hypothetical protein